MLMILKIFSFARARRGITLLVLLTLAPFMPHRAFAALAGDTKVPFTAERTVIVKGKSYTGQMWAVPGEQRHEQIINGFHLIAIVRADRHLVWLMVPEFRVYTELPLEQAWMGYADTNSLDRAQSNEMIAGLDANKYPLHRQNQDGSKFDGKLWLTPANILVKFDGVQTAPHGHQTPVALTLTHIEKGPQNPTLFELPGGMSKLPAQALEPLLGIKG